MKKLLLSAAAGDRAPMFGILRLVISFYIDKLWPTVAVRWLHWYQMREPPYFDRQAEIG